MQVVICFSSTLLQDLHFSSIWQTWTCLRRIWDMQIPVNSFGSARKQDFHPEGKGVVSGSPPPLVVFTDPWTVPVLLLRSAAALAVADFLLPATA